MRQSLQMTMTIDGTPFGSTRIWKTAKLATRVAPTRRDELRRHASEPKNRCRGTKQPTTQKVRHKVRFCLVVATHSHAAAHTWCFCFFRSQKTKSTSAARIFSGESECVVSFQLQSVCRICTRNRETASFSTRFFHGHPLFNHPFGNDMRQ